MPAGVHDTGAPPCPASARDWRLTVILRTTERSVAVSNLIAVAYPDVDTAEAVRAELVDATKEHLLTLEDAVVVVHEPGGKIKLNQAMSPTATGAAGGAVWGGLIGLLFLAPVVGMAVGAASGALGGKMADVGVDDKFMKTLGEKLTPGTAALVVLSQSSAPEKVLERISKYGGEVIQSSLTDDQEEHLRAALAEPAARA
jgi:uncharacterized membrane protein